MYCYDESYQTLQLHITQNDQREKKLDDKTRKSKHKSCYIFFFSRVVHIFCQSSKPKAFPALKLFIELLWHLNEPFHEKSLMLQGSLAIWGRFMWSFVRNLLNIKFLENVQPAWVYTVDDMIELEKGREKVFHHYNMQRLNYVLINFSSFLLHDTRHVNEPVRYRVELKKIFFLSVKRFSAAFSLLIFFRSLAKCKLTAFFGARKKLSQRMKILFSTFSPQQKKNRYKVNVESNKISVCSLKWNLQHDF